MYQMQQVRFLNIMSIMGTFWLKKSFKLWDKSITFTSWSRWPLSKSSIPWSRQLYSPKDDTGGIRQQTSETSKFQNYTNIRDDLYWVLEPGKYLIKSSVPRDFINLNKLLKWLFHNLYNILLYVSLNSVFKGIN